MKVPRTKAKILGTMGGRRGEAKNTAGVYPETSEQTGKKIKKREKSSLYPLFLVMYCQKREEVTARS